MAALLLAAAAVVAVSARQAAPASPRPLEVSHSARALAPGEAVLLTFKAAAGPLTAVRGTAFGQPFSAYHGASADTWHALVGIDLSARPGRATIDVEARLADGSPLAASLPLTVEREGVPHAAVAGRAGIRDASAGRAGADRA